MKNNPNACVRFWFGNDTFGRGVEVAQRADGEFFCRFYEFNGFGKGWLKWAKHDSPNFETHGVNRYSGESFEYSKPQLFWGFQRLTEAEGPFRFRLPKKEV